MFVLDTDTLSHFLRAQGRVTERVQQASEEVVITLISRIEILQGRFASVLKAEDGEKLILAQQRLEETEKDLKISPLTKVFQSFHELSRDYEAAINDLLILGAALSAARQRARNGEVRWPHRAAANLRQSPLRAGTFAQMGGRLPTGQTPTPRNLDRLSDGSSGLVRRSRLDIA
jgi:tRNA(fMet)-specific endonuclease VapC